MLPPPPPRRRRWPAAAADFFSASIASIVEIMMLGWIEMFDWEMGEKRTQTETRKEIIAHVHSLLAAVLLGRCGKQYLGPVCLSSNF